MKMVRIAAILLVITLLTVIINSIVLKNVIDEILAEVTDASDDDAELAIDEYSEIYEKYQRMSSYISLTVNHEDLTDIENSFAEIIGAAKSGDLGGIVTIKSRLISALQHLRRLSGINIDSIF